MESATTTTQEWAASLVGRDWEIYWNDDEDNDEKEVSATAPASSVAVDAPSDLTGGDNDDGENGSQGDIIDDWYAGSVLAATVQDNGTVLVKVLFVGDEQLYEMELGPTKVRASARGWIKRSMAILSRRGDLPPDTATHEDRRHLQTLQEDTRQYEAISFPQPKEGITVPTVEELKEIMELRKLLAAQVYLRSNLAPIVNLHGSIKYVDGEPNPTEPLVNHLVECCKDVIQACDWYLKCWELLTTCFGQRSGQSSNESESRHERSIDYNKVLNEYLESGKNWILNCATMDLESTTTKRRQLATPTNQRRPKRRRKNSQKWAETAEGGLEVIADEGDFRCMVFVDQFVQHLNQPSQSWFLPIFAEMFHTLAHYVVDPLVRWKLQVNLLLGRKDDLEGVLEVEETPTSPTTLPTDDLSTAQQSNTSREELKDDDMSVDSSEAEQGRAFTYEEVEACLRALEGNPVLSLLDASQEEDALQSILRVIETTAVRARSFLERLAEDTTAPSDTTPSDQDEVLEGLQEIRKELNSPDNFAFNIDPIGKPGALVTREVIEVAVEWRGWLLDVRHASLVRERKFFLENLGKRMKDLPELSGVPPDLHIGSMSQRRGQAEQQVCDMQANLASLVQTEQRYREILNKNDEILFSKEGVQKALDELGALPVLLLEEEKLALRLSLLEWSEEASVLLPDERSPIAFPQLEKLYHSLQQILKGKARNRTKMIAKVEANEKTESLVRSFVAEDTRRIDSDRSGRVTALYVSSSQWKERAEAIISTLRMHGNASVGDPRPSLKLPSMVDIKRISDLVAEYKTLGVEISGYTSCLQKVLADASEWSGRLEDNLLRESSPMEDCFTVLTRESQLRPKGLIMDPTRQVIETLLDLLEWYQKSKSTLNKVVVLLRTAERGSSLRERFSDIILSDVYPLLAEGCALVEMFSHENQFKFQASAVISGRILEGSRGIRRSARALVRERLEAHPLGSSLLHRLVRMDIDTREGSPLAMYLWYDWHLIVDSFVLCVDDPEGNVVRTLSEARNLMSEQPRLETAGDHSPLRLLGGCTSNTTGRFKQLVEDAEASEKSIYELLSRSRDLRKGCMEKADSVRQHLTDLKEQHSLFKDRSNGKQCLMLDTLLEPQLEHHIKVFTWLVSIDLLLRSKFLHDTPVLTSAFVSIPSRLFQVRTFSYPFLYLDEASYSDARCGEDNEDTRVPWDVLVTLFERVPLEEEVPIDDFALVSLRVRELYHAARKWQDEITRSTLLSNRGGKRRGLGAPPSKGEHDGESSKLQLEQMEQLAANPILSKVAMPREGAVKRILQNSKEFEIQLHSFLGKDFDGPNPDRAAYPDSHSLVGDNGEFILFRLTGSELFEYMQKSMKELSVVAENVFAETPGKTTFDWIDRAVTWIEELNDSVTKESPFQVARENILVVPEERGRELVKSGAEIFLNIPDDLKRTLSHHGIFVSTNKQEQSLRVVLKKDGAHHSVGGTVIRWCPILFECLKADVTRLETWQRELKTTHEEFSGFFARTKTNPKDREEDLYQWYCFRERAVAILDDGARSLVVAPTQGLVNVFGNLAASLENYLSKHTKAELGQKFAKMWFMEGTSLLDDRFVLLESLLYRKSFVATQQATEGLPEAGGKTFRDACRSYLVTSFTKAAKTIGMIKLRNNFSPRVVESFCCIKAWEIENEMFDRFQDDLGVTRVSDEYRNKARNLRASLDNKNNLSLCLQVLVGDISADSIVSMTKDQLASQKAKLDRARAEKEARSSANLTPEIDAESNDKGPSSEKRESEEGSKAGQSMKGTAAAKPTSILRKSRSSSSQLASQASAAAGGTGNGNPTPPGGDKLEGKAHSPVVERQLLTSSEDVSPAAPPKFAIPKTAPPPPPPSLVTAFKQTSDDTSEDEMYHGQQVLNESGGHKFRFEIGNLRLGFNAALYLEDEESVSGLDGFLPGSLAERGRVPEKEFIKFVKEKAKGGRWMSVALRLDPISDNDDREYKRFCRAYEEKERIVSITVSPNTKVFLVTPQFHKAANQNGIESFSSRTNSYAVVLTKDTRLFRNND